MMLPNNNYQQFAPFDIVAVNETFRKLYDRSGKVYQLDYDNSPPLNAIVDCPKDAALADDFENDDWLKMEHDIVRSDNSKIHFMRFIHNSIREAYLRRTNGIIMLRQNTK